LQATQDTYIGKNIGNQNGFKLWVGYKGGDQLYLSYLRFQDGTTKIPSGASLVSAKICLKRSSSINSGPCMKISIRPVKLYPSWGCTAKWQGSALKTFPGCNTYTKDFFVGKLCESDAQTQTYVCKTLSNFGYGDLKNLSERGVQIASQEEGPSTIFYDVENGGAAYIEVTYK